MAARPPRRRSPAEAIGGSAGPAAGAAAAGQVPLPRRLLARLQGAFPGVVAPVGVGLGQAALCHWAERAGLVVVDAAPAPGLDGWLWRPARRAELIHLAPSHADALVLADADGLLDADDWAAALPGQPRAVAEASFATCGGWPAALPLAQALPGESDLHAHPLASTRLGPLLPPAALLGAARRLAVAALVTPAVADALGVEAERLDALHDGGWLWHAPPGLAFPTLMRRLLCPRPGAAAARRAARALEGDGHVAAALRTLSQAAVWPDYLALLASTARAAQGEAALRAALAPLPERWRSAPAALHVAGLLARAAGDAAAAAGLYTRAIAGGLEPPVAAQAHNARGVVHAMAGEVAAALADFDIAAGAGGVTAGEACRNRATLLVQQARHDDAERSLQAAVAAFREAGDLLREARSLETLGSLQFGRGLLREALAPYRKALDLLLPAQPEAAAMVLLNLAECQLGLGDADAAAALQRDAAALNAIVASPVIAGWLERIAALADVQAGRHDAALSRLQALRSDDAALLAECALLQARVLREQGRAEAALAALEPARPLGLRADVEAALIQGGAALDAAIAEARRHDARVELATALLARTGDADLAEALALIRQHGWRALLDAPAAAPLVRLAEDAATRALFPLKLQTFGPLRITHAGRVLQLSDVPARKSAALLVALALAAKPLPREALAERFWPDAKNPVASLQTAIYHLRATFGVAVVGGERGLLELLFPVESDVAALQRALSAGDARALAACLRHLPQPAAFLPDLPAELDEERGDAQRLLLDALRAHADAQPAHDVRRRDALRALLATDPLDTESREALIGWHERRGEHDLAAQEQRRLDEALAALGLR